MKKISLKTLSYTAEAYAKLDETAFRKHRDIYRFRQDVFPNPDSFNLKILSITAETVKDENSPVYPYRLLVSVFFDDQADDGRVERFKAAMEAKAARFNVVQRKPVEPPKKGEPKSEKPEETPKQESKRQERKQKTLEETVLDQRINNDIREELQEQSHKKKRRKKK